MAIQAALTGDPVAIFRAIAHDPLTAAVLSLAEIRQMVNQLFAQNQDYLPPFQAYKSFKCNCQAHRSLGGKLIL
jgi:alpha-galactosidase